jgi:hypothetical protein
MEYATVARMGIPNPQAHLQAAFPDGVALPSCFVAAEVASQVDAAAEEALAAGSWWGSPNSVPCPWESCWGRIAAGGVQLVAVQRAQRLCMAACA